METPRIHRRIDLTAAEWQRLDELAELPHLRPTRGHGPIVVSWRSLIKRIATGELDVSEREPYVLPPGLDEQAEAVEERQRLEQARQEQQRRVQAHTAQKQAVRKTPALKQMHMSLELEPA